MMSSARLASPSFAVCVAALLLPLAAPAATLIWDTNPGSPGPQGGTGNWLAQNVWVNGATNLSWVSTSDAFFSNGTGTVTLSADTAARSLSFASAHTLSGTGRLALVGSPTQIVNVASGVSATIDLELLFPSGAATLDKEGPGELTLRRRITAPTPGAQLAVKAGTLILAAGAGSDGEARVSTGATLRVVGAAEAAELNGSGNVVLDSSLTLRASGLRSGSFTGDISGVGPLVIGFDGGASGLSQTVGFGNNTFTRLEVRSSTLSLLTAGAVSPQVAVTHTGGLIELRSGDQTFGTLSGANFSATSPARIDLGTATLTVGGNNVESSYAGEITGSGMLRKTGNGTLTLTGNSTFTGGAEILAGSVVIPAFANASVPSALGSGGPITLGGPASLGTIRPQDGSATNRPLIIPGGGGRVTIAAADDVVTLSGGISGSGQFSKTGPGLLVINGVSPLTGGVLVSQGELQLNGTLSAGAGTLSIDRDATLSGNGAASGPVFVDGTLAPGAPVGTLSTGPLVLQASSTLELTLDSPTAFDQVSVTGDVSLLGTGFGGTASLALTLGFDPRDFVDAFTIVLNDGTDAVNGRFTVAGNILLEGERFFAAGQEWEIRYAAGDGNDVALLAVPEPSIGFATLLGAAMLLRRRPGQRQTATA